MFVRLHDQMVKMNQSLHRLQGTWRDTQLSGGPATELREQFERLMTVYLSTKAATTQPAMLQNCLNLQASCAALLVQLSLGNQGPEHIPLTFPLPALENSLLCFVPGIPIFVFLLSKHPGSHCNFLKTKSPVSFTEFFAENMGDFFIFLRRFADEVLESSAESLEHVLTFITVFMGNVDRCEPV